MSTNSQLSAILDAGLKGSVSPRQPSQYVFSLAQTQVLTAGVAATVSLFPFPSGITVESPGIHYLYITDGANSELVLLTAVSQYDSVSFTPSKSHTTWSLGSATSGIQEAVIANPNGRIYLPTKYNTYSRITLIGLYQYTLYGDADGILGTVAGITNIGTDHTFYRQVAVNANLPVIFMDLMLEGNTNCGTGIYSDALNSGLRVIRCGIHAHDYGIYMSRNYYGVISECNAIYQNRRSGIHLDRCNNITIDSNVLTGNSASSSGNANISIAGSSALAGESLCLRITNNDIETAGFPAQIGYGISAVNAHGIIISGNQFEGNITNAVYLGANTRAVSIFGNFMLSTGLVIDTASEIKVFANRFDGAGGGISVTTAQGKFITIEDNVYTNGATVTTLNVQEFDGGTLTSAGIITLPSSGGEIVAISGVTGITSITASWPGRRITLFFLGTLTVTSGANLLLNGNFNAVTNSTISIICLGNNWVETGRKA